MVYLNYMGVFLIIFFIVFLISVFLASMSTIFFAKKFTTLVRKIFFIPLYLFFHFVFLLGILLFFDLIFFSNLPTESWIINKDMLLVAFYSSPIGAFIALSLYSSNKKP